MWCARTVRFVSGVLYHSDTESCQTGTGTWRNLPGSVAIKTIVFQSDSHVEHALVSEAAIAHNLVHPNTVATYAHEVSALTSGASPELQSWKLYLIQEYCDGGCLREHIARGVFARCAHGSACDLRTARALRWRRIYHTALGIAQGMAYVHSQGVLHTDLNPSNVLLKVRGRLSLIVSGQSMQSQYV
jgi:serine/threonine protein kinase